MKCIDVILKNEGGYINHPHDTGEETNFGISKKSYPDLDIKNLTKNHAIEIYHEDYWNKMNLLGIHNEDLILHLFDMGVNAGIKTAIKMVQRLINVTADGIVGPQTIKAINNFPSIVDTYKQERKKYYFTIARRNPNLEVFLAGWLNRIDNTKFS